LVVKAPYEFQNRFVGLAAKAAKWLNPHDFLVVNDCSNYLTDYQFSFLEGRQLSRSIKHPQFRKVTTAHDLTFPIKEGKHLSAFAVVVSCYPFG